MKKIWFLSLGAMFVSFLVIPLTGLAQETTAEATAIKDITQNQHSKAIIVADVDIYNAKLDSQNKHQLTISFQLSNGKKVQPDVQYAVFLTKKDEKGNQITVGKKIYPEVVNLGENQKIDKVIKYTAPAYLDGEYTLWMQSANSVGMIYSVAHIGTVKFQKEKEYIEIQPNSCFLTIGKEEKKYSLGQGVDVKPEENITIHCTLNNHFNQDKTVIPKLVTHLRSSYGKILTAQESSQKISIKANQTQDVLFLIPKVTDPQAYDATLTFLENKQLVSNSTRLHYVIVGESATIQNIRLNKPTYQKGETAKLSFFWSGRADQFSDARYAKNPQPLKTPQVTVAISDQNGNSCSSLFTQKLNPEIRKAGDLNLTLNIPISKECLGARAEIKILDSQGKVLTQRKVQSPQQKVQKTNKTIPQKTNNTTRNILLIIIFLGLGLIIIAIVIKYINNKKGKNPPSSSAGMKALFFLAALAGGMFLVGNGVEATTFSVDGGRGGEGDHLFSAATYSVSLNKSEYAPGETATMSGSTSVISTCANDAEVAAMDGLIGDSGIIFLFNHWKNASGSGGNTFGSISGKVEDVPGDYQAWARGYAVSGLENSKIVSIPYTVVGPPSCTLTFSPINITAPASSTATWTSTNATSAKYSCSGPIKGSGGWGSIGVNGSMPFSFSKSQTGTEKCTIIVKNSAGDKDECSGSVSIKAPTPKSCNLPWGGTISSGSKTKAYKNSSVSCGSTCQSQTRTCNNGTLSGSYTNKSCSVDACPTPDPDSCIYPTCCTDSNGINWTADSGYRIPSNCTCDEHVGVGVCPLNFPVACDGHCYSAGTQCTGCNGSLVKDPCIYPTCCTTSNGVDWTADSGYRIPSNCTCDETADIGFTCAPDFPVLCDDHCYPAGTQCTSCNGSFTFDLSFDADPSSGDTPLTTQLTATTGGFPLIEGHLGTVKYSYWKDCNDTCSTEEDCIAACGKWNTQSVIWCDDPEVCKTFSISETYDSAGTYTPKIVAERQGYYIWASVADTASVTAVCTDTSWAPATDTVCSGTDFTQTSNCKNTRTATGTKQPAYKPAQCVYTSTGDSCSDANNCGKTITTKISACKELADNECAQIMRDSNACNPACSDITETCPACYNPWKEVAP